MIKPCQGCTENDNGKCRAGICAAVRCLMIAKKWPIPNEPARLAGPKLPSVKG